MSSHTSLLLILTMWVSMHDGLSLSLINQLETETQDVDEPQRLRTKRCSCSNQLDTECHYFCHLDIIWVNSPSKTTIYGLGNPLARRRRSIGRCTCASPQDHSCSLFCFYRVPRSKSEKAFNARGNNPHLRVQI